MYRVDLNADIGESFGSHSLGVDEAILDYVTSANIACGFHAGDPDVMRTTVSLAKGKGVAIGAHPGLPDLVGFGRRTMGITPAEAYSIVLYQVGALMAFCNAANVRMQHVKPHGALYNMAANDKQLAMAIAHAVHDVNPQLILYGLSGSELVKAGQEAGLPTASEVFADRTYTISGALTPRSEKDALIVDDLVACEQAVRMIKEGVVRSQQGMDVPVLAETVCIHGDGPHALPLAKLIHDTLSQRGVVVVTCR